MSYKTTVLGNPLSSESHTLQPTLKLAHSFFKNIRLSSAGESHFCLCCAKEINFDSRSISSSFLSESKTLTM